MKKVVNLIIDKLRHVVLVKLLIRIDHSAKIYLRLSATFTFNPVFSCVFSHQGGSVIDKVWIVKDLHGPEAWVTNRPNN